MVEEVPCRRDVMFVPVPTGSVPSSNRPAFVDEPLEMTVAIRLLSGTDCERDAAQAHVMLVRLSESRDPVVKSEAARILKAGASNDWFGGRVPRFYELERIAEKTLARRESEPARRRLAMTVVMGLAVLIGGVVAYLVAADAGDIDRANMPIVILTMIVVLAAVFLLKMQRRD